MALPRHLHDDAAPPSDRSAGIGTASDLLQAMTLALGLFGVAALAWMWACR